MMKISLTAFFLFIALIAKGQQDAQFSQYMFNMLYVNPAYAGYKENLYLHTAVRSQWTGIAGAPQTMSLAADWNPGEKTGLGILVEYDKLGAQSSMGVYGNYSYKLQLNAEDAVLAFGLGFGFVQAGVDGSKLDPIDVNDNYVATQLQQKIFPDARAGVFYSDDKYYLAFSVDNMLARFPDLDQEQNFMVARPSPHFYLTGGTLLPLNGGMKVKPSFLVKDDIKGPTSLDLNLFLFLNDRISVGGFYRTAVSLYEKKHLQSNLQKKNSTGLLTEFFATDRLRLGYSFDYSLTKFGSYSYGSHEISLGYVLGRNKDMLRCYF